MLFHDLYKRPSRYAVPALMAVTAVWLSGCAENGVMTPLGPVAAGERSHLISFFLWMLPISLPLLIGTPWIALRYRRRGGKGKYDPNWSHSVAAETAIWGGATLTFLIVGWLTWGHVMGEDPYKPTGKDPIHVQVIGSEWKWMFIYPDKMATVNKLVLPQHTPVVFDITATGAMQSFWIPRLAGQIYAMPGMGTKMNLTTGDTSEIFGFNSQFNGAAFPLDKFEVDVVTKEQYDAFLQEPKNPWAQLEAAFKKTATWSGPGLFEPPMKDYWMKVMMNPSIATDGGAAILPDNSPAQKAIDKAINQDLHLSQLNGGAQ
ncbi:cytochrome ubiquinol oxidase subunit II [Thioclava sp. L04-15]|uniref:cytochrome ubiquinol oxidase subunit II n=1 Tax=Thioclava sp. L04-15 TaxID=1915318 RepID=UPI0011BA4BD4|nr:cytochrome ubiquinol oxidase subunit II [Thioclava sp. L04-15]TNE85567.1 MAG: cytochrome ubiquinol oxidase subunit II [Paracoccaceae bacterium]